MADIKRFTVEHGAHVEIQWEGGLKMDVMPYRGDGIEGLLGELTNGGTFTSPGGAETITWAGDLVVRAYDPARSVAHQRDIEGDKAALTRWLAEEERLNEERPARLAWWREELGRMGDAGEPQDLAAD